MKLKRLPPGRLGNLPPPEDIKPGIETILRFVNADLDDPNDVAGLQPIQTTFSVGGRGDPILGSPQLPHRLKDKTALREHQAVLRSLLEAFRTGQGIRRAEKELGEVLESIQVTASWMKFRSNEGMPLAISIHASTIAQWYSYGLACLIDRRLDKRISRCKLKDCQRYFIDWPGKRGHSGKAQLFCCASHGSIDKQRRYRKKKRKEKSMS